VSGRDFSRAVSALTRIGLQPLSCSVVFVAPAGVPDHARCSRGGVEALLPVEGKVLASCLEFV